MSARLKLPNVVAHHSDPESEDNEDTTEEYDFQTEDWLNDLSDFLGCDREDL